ncbi:Aminopeptidase 1 [Fibrisoma limi BUZ 3]|uniref:Aminopeptidase N n=1 Tax=Fibrisoma limi BUZ 3 TaxID=1185876 RepID=I2GBJ2_9BACT|nr:M1 family aminopeptidase [Fibrisoma limi]CCH51266.1 Aminopeptidase 1 [Fibrisoma limi BUZ 3]
MNYRLFILLLLFPLLASAQDEANDGARACQQGKVRYFGRLATDPRARVMYPGDSSIDVTYYGLDLRLTHTPAYLQAAVTIGLKSTTPALSSFALDLRSGTTPGAGLRVDSVKAGNQRLTFRHEQNKLTITPPQPLARGQALAVTVFYQGRPGTGGFGGFVFGTHSREPEIWSLSEPFSAPEWFPCKDTPADKADSSAVSITAPARFVSVSNGTLESTADNPDGTRTYRWRNHYPIAHYLISVAMTNYVRYDTPFTYNGVTLPVTHYLYPESLADNQANLDQTPDMLRVFTERYGPYPFLREKYGHAQFGAGVGGMEHQTISSMGTFDPSVIAHELAHQWFGDKVTCRDWHSIWLNEGFATYSEYVYREARNGRANAASLINYYMRLARTAKGSLYVRSLENVDSIFTYNRTYAKGAVVLHMLRGIVGDTLFFRTLRTYAATPGLAYGTALTDDFRAVAEQVSNQNLAYFFQQWIFGEGYPAYRVSYTGNGTARGVALRIEQRNGNPSGQQTFFTMPIQVRVQSAAGDTTLTVLNDRPDQTFNLTGRGSVTGVAIDPDNYILKTVDYVNTITALPAATDLAVQVFPNPSAETLSVSFGTALAGPVTLTFTNVSGQAVRVLTEAMLPPGSHTRAIGMRGLPAGRYVLTVKTPTSQQSRVVLHQ